MSRSSRCGSRSSNADGGSPEPRRRSGSRGEAAPIFEGTLAEAEATLTRLHEHQVEADAAETAYDAFDAAIGPIAVAEKLAAEGFGPASQTQCRRRPLATQTAGYRRHASIRSLISFRDGSLQEHDDEHPSPSPQSVMGHLYLCFFYHRPRDGRNRHRAGAGRPRDEGLFRNGRPHADRVLHYLTKTICDNDEAGKL